MNEGHESYSFALAVIREMRIRSGTIQPKTDQEHEWAKAGEVSGPELDTVKEWERKRDG